MGSSFRRYSTKRLEAIVRQAQEVLDERDLTRNGLLIERFLEIHNPARGCQVQQNKEHRRSGFFDCDGIEHSVEVTGYSCQTHGTSSERRFGEIN